MGGSESHPHSRHAAGNDRLSTPGDDRHLNRAKSLMRQKTHLTAIAVCRRLRQRALTAPDKQTRKFAEATGRSVVRVRGNAPGGAKLLNGVPARYRLFS